LSFEIVVTNFYFGSIIEIKSDTVADL